MSRFAKGSILVLISSPLLIWQALQIIGVTKSAPGGLLLLLMFGTLIPGVVLIELGKRDMKKQAAKQIQEAGQSEE
jgi:hypothetical protein